MQIPKLIIEARQGSAAAQKCLFDIYKGRLTVVCRSYVKSMEDAEECLLDGFLNIFNGLQSFEYNNEGAFYQWMRKAMINRCLMFLRKKNVFNLLAETAAEDLPVADEVLDKLAAAELYGLINRLPVGSKSVFNLYIFEDMNHNEIAEMLGIAEGTSKSQLANARKLLQRMITENENYYARNEQNK